MTYKLALRSALAEKARLTVGANLCGGHIPCHESAVGVILTAEILFTLLSFFLQNLHVELVVQLRTQLLQRRFQQGYLLCVLVREQFS